MIAKFKIFLIILPISCLVIGLYYFFQNNSVALFNPQGVIASKEKKLIVFTLTLALGIVVPLFLSTIFISWRYRAGNEKAGYSPNSDHPKFFDYLWWIIPGVIIVILAIVNWQSTHELDPFKPINSPTPPITIQVVALRWKWLFIYPTQKIATVNFIEFPVNTPINFELTADAPMNSFWIPQLGGQIYAMSGMVTQTHLMATTIGEFPGSDAEISGAGFAGMRFVAKSVTSSDFAKWSQTIQKSSPKLDLKEYGQLAKPSTNDPAAEYSLADQNLYNQIVSQFMAAPSPSPQPMEQMMPGMQM